MNSSQDRSRFSLLAAWSLAFGCAVGSDAVVLPWTDFLPNAGPVGSLLGLLVGAAIMGVIAWNYHYMMNRRPGPGGAYDYAKKAFGNDHGFVCGWFLLLTYVAIVWLDATAVTLVARYALGDGLRFGFRYAVGGAEISLGDVLVSAASVAVAAAVCCRSRLSGRVQTVLAVVFAAGVVACFAAALLRHEGGLETLAPAFAPDGTSPASQVLRFVAISAWLFVGFESISHASGEFRFPLSRSFGVMAAAIAAAVAAYVLLTAIPVLSAGAGGWAASQPPAGDLDVYAFSVAGRPFGRMGAAVVGAMLVGAVFTNLVGNTFAASRLMAAMADDGVLPAWLGGKNADGAPRNAVVLIALLAAAVAPLGRMVISVVVGLSIVGAAIAYAYTSAAAFKTARARGERFPSATGLLGAALAIGVTALFALPILASDATQMAPQSYLVLIVWTLAGLAAFLSVFRRDRVRRFGRSPVVWLSLSVFVLFLSLMWVRQTSYDTTDAAFEDIVRVHGADCEEFGDAAAGHVHEKGKWLGEIVRMKAVVNASFMRNGLVQAGLTMLTLVLMVFLFGVLRRREREMEEEKAKAKSYFFSTVSHDIRTPLNAIIGFSEMLKAGFSTEEERDQAVESILVSSKTLLGLINDVLDLSKLESGKMQIVPEPTDVAALLHGVMDAFRVSGGKPELELVCRTDGLPVLLLDPQRLRQIAFNLVGNAMKFTEQGRVELRASFREGGDGTGLFRMEVEDTGCGIGENDQKRLGTAYVQVGEMAKHVVGTGLGLAICRQLAAAMGGALQVESELGKGSTFTISVPGVKVAKKETDGTTGTTRTDGTNHPTTQPPSHPTTKLRILVVDDSKMNVMVLKALLNHIGSFDVAVAMDGLEALKTLEASDRSFDLVLTDMWMPNLDGAELVKAIRANPALASLRVIAVTADVEMQSKVLSLGFDGILFKPITTEKLRQTIAKEGK